MKKVQALTIEEHKKAHQPLTQYANTHQESEIQKLNNFLMKNYQGRLNGEKTPIDMAISLLKGEK